MKKIIYGVAAAAVALLSACETLAPQENVSEIVSSVTSEKVVLTATIGNDDTKTYLEWDRNVFKTRWAEGDQIYLFDADVSYENAEEAMSQFNIISGVGESTAQFELARGYMPENYVAFYGSCGLLDNGDWSFWINHNQSARSDSHEQSIDDDCFPMVAVGSGTDLRFKNLCSVLKLNITGDGEVLDAISISSKDEGVFLSGYSHLNLEGTRPSYWFSDEYYWLSHYNDVLFDPEDDVVLSSEPYECYIVLASQTYPSGLSIKIGTDNGFMEVETEDNLVLSQSELREIPALKFETEVSYENAWKIEFPKSGAIPIVLEEEGEYLVAKNKEMLKNLGIDKLIYPEVLAATEIVQSLKRSWIREYRTFSNEALVLVCVKVRENAEIINKVFSTGFFNHSMYRIVAVKRHTTTIIPSGNDQILANDLVYFICSKENLEYVRTAAGKTKFDIKNIIIMGGSKIALKTVQYLPNDINVKIIESDRERCYELADKTDTLIIHGDGRNVDLLKDEGIEDADAFIALTDNSETNVLACLAAKRFGLRKTIAEVENIDYIDLITMGVASVEEAREDFKLLKEY